MANIGNAASTRPSIHVYLNGAGAPAATYFSAFIAFFYNSTAGVLFITYNSTASNSTGTMFAAGTDNFINFSYITST
jgi:hypothetical protein